MSNPNLSVNDNMSNPILNVNGNKRPNGDNMKSACLWPCCLGHTSERCMTKLPKGGSLGSFDCDSFEKFESFLLGKDDQVALYWKG